MTSVTEDLAAFLTRHGWSKVRVTDAGATLWALPSTSAELHASADLPNSSAEMYVPRFLRRGSFEWSDIIERVADAQSEPVKDIERRLDMVGTDVMRFRVDSNSSQSIPLEAGATVIGSAFGMIRASATSARRPRQSIGNNYSVVGDAIAREARLAHTEIGSFIFPVWMPVGDPLPDPQAALDGLAHAQPESEERRVVRTLAQALRAFEQMVIEPAKDPTMADLTPVVIAGGTKEVFAHLSRALAEPGVSWFETGFEWATKEAPPSDAPERVTIPSEARPIVERAVRLLSQPARHATHVFTGPITQIGHEPGDPIGRIVVQAPSPTGRRLGHIEVTVRAEQLTELHHWMDNVTTVVVSGELERVPGRMPQLRGVTKPVPLSETMLAVEADKA